ncbi:uncharacterized protein BDZ99DRAFT_531792 [Mytilinidion resinicola]|uniref:Uncharacterized protein n=1 Tax=Mytilinidion resinicola TaxID=574789 RepID=A0A6A6YKR1_9PEZI|nr:uncharacterized protein BDZ99DRAFT_531792 [Mytilinidion resinicola]KAF2809456.1 hypothetical protein BDZ99DRAFT_531792 [Mytilinidion resinicola]
MATQIGQFYIIEEEENLNKSILIAQDLPKHYYKHPVVIVGSHPGTGNPMVYPTLREQDGLQDIQNKPNDRRWYFPLRSLQAHHDGTETATMEMTFAFSSRILWTPRWIDVRKRYEVEEKFLHQYIESDGPFSTPPTILSSYFLELLKAYAAFIPGVIVWLPQPELIHPSSIIFQQVTSSKIFGRPVVVTEFDRSNGIITFHLSTTMGNKTFRQINAERASDKFFNRALRHDYLVLVDKKDDSVDYGFKVATLREDSAPLIKQSFMNVKEKFQIEYVYLNCSLSKKNKYRVMLDDASLDLVRTEVAAAQAHPLMWPLKDVPYVPPKWEEIEDGKVYLLPEQLPNPTVLHEQTAQDKINIYGRACLVTGKKNGMVRVLPMREFGEVPIASVFSGDKVTERRERSLHLAVEGYGAKSHDNTPLLNLRHGSPQFLKPTFVTVEKDYYVEYTNLRAWSPIPIFLDASALETILEYRRRNHLDKTNIPKSTEEALAGNHPFCHGLAVSMPYGQENEQHHVSTRVEQTPPNFRGALPPHNIHYNQHFHHAYMGPPQPPVSIHHQWPQQHTGQATFGPGSIAPRPTHFHHPYTHTPTAHPYATHGAPYRPVGMPVFNQGGQPPPYPTVLPPHNTLATNPGARMPFSGNQPSQAGAHSGHPFFQERSRNFFQKR